jgi:2-polyprenyl-3-methyl-5-hydroxy-6-metoxy-1,4-benzoquinol methylase
VSAGPEFYDAAYADPDGPATLAYRDTPMRDLYDGVYAKIKRLDPVVDLGCGNGLFAQCLRARGYCGSYRGIDFSRRAIAEAEQLLSLTEARVYAPEDEVPEATYEFRVQDLRGWQELPGPETHYTTYVCLEVLEHLEDDVDLVARIPARARVIFSVPNFWSEAHVRTYDHVGTAFGRFGNLLDFVSWRLYPTANPRGAIHLYEAYRRADAW